MLLYDSRYSLLPRIEPLFIVEQPCTVFVGCNHEYCCYQKFGWSLWGQPIAGFDLNNGICASLVTGENGYT